jgi:parvulin-like peptidyl-prolyl isomerase
MKQTITVDRITIWLLPFLLLLAPPVAGQGDTAPPAPVARVNGQILTRVDLDREIETIKRSRSPVVGRDGHLIAEKLRQEALDRLIALELLNQAARREGITFPAAEIDRIIADRQQRFPGGKTAFEKALHEKGSSVAEFRRAIEKEKMADRLINTVIAEEITITEAELQRIYTQNQKAYTEPEKATVRHIFVKSSPTNSGTGLEKIKAAQRRLEEGEAFAKVASMYSESGNALQGGLLGTLYRGQASAELDKAIFNLAPEQISPIVQTRSGYHLLQVLDRSSQRLLPFDEVRERIASRLHTKRLHQRVKQFVQDQKRSSSIIVF